MPRRQVHEEEDFLEPGPSREYAILAITKNSSNPLLGGRHEVNFSRGRHLRSVERTPPLCQVPRDSCEYSRKVSLNLVLPHTNYGPSVASESVKVAFVTLAVDRNLLLPKRRKLLTPHGKPVAMPEVAVYEYDYPCRSENDVRPARKVATVLLEAQPTAMKSTPHPPLEVGVCVPHP
jgi:hypothetical protein